MEFQGKGYRIHYEQQGSGRDVLLLHGWGGRLESWKPLIRDLSILARVTALDFPGHGESTLPPEPWSVTEFAEAVAQWMEAIGLKQADVVAHSFGGRVALVLAARYPEKVGRLVLTGVPVPGLLPQKTPAGRKLKSQVYGLLKSLCSPRLLGEKRAALCREALVQRFGSPDYRVLSQEMRATFNRVIRQPLAEEARAVQSPTLLVWGDQDTAAPIAIARALETQMRDAGLVVFEGADHFAYLGEYPRFWIVLRKFLLES